MRRRERERAIMVYREKILASGSEGTIFRHLAAV